MEDYYMNHGQEKFYAYILERVQHGKQEEARALLEESFQKQKDKTFSKEFMEEFMIRMSAILKPQHIEEVQETMGQFRTRYVK